MWTPAQGRLGGKNMVVLVPLSGCILGMILLFFFPFIITEFIQQLFFALLPIIGLVIAIISNIFLFISLKKSKSMILKIFCLLILLSEMLFLSYKVYNDIYINHIIKVTLEIKNESPTENIFKVQVKYKNESEWQTVYIENTNDKLEQVFVRGAPFSIRVINYNKSNSPKDKPTKKSLTYFEKKYIQIPKNTKCSFTYNEKKLKIDVEKLIIDSTPLFDYNIMVYLKPSNETAIYNYIISEGTKQKYFELTTKNIVYFEDFPQNIYCYKAESTNGFLHKNSSFKSINNNGKIIHNFLNKDIYINYKLNEPIKIIDIGSEIFISEEKPDFYRFEIKD